MRMNIETKMCGLLLVGARGDLRQNREGSFVYWAKDLPAECATPALVSFTDEYAMHLTPAGAEFILENLWTERSLPEKRFLRLRAEGAV